MKNFELSEKDLREIERFKTGFPSLDVTAPATVANGGIKALSEEQADDAVLAAGEALSGKGSGKLTFAKFVPASGAASRMFKDLFAKKPETVEKFASNLDYFAFYDKALFAGRTGEAAVDFTLSGEGLGYGSKPKGVLKFHRYPSEVRTALAEHLVEAASYLKEGDGTAHLVITISPEHRAFFEQAISEVKEEYEKRFNVRYDIKLVYQYKWTDTIAVRPDNEPFLDDGGEPLHRPAGHGALIHNLADVDADIVSIKNIDNVAVESYLPLTVRWKKVLLGTAIRYREKIFSYLDALESHPSESLCEEITGFLRDELCLTLEGGRQDADTLAACLNRPLRVCGMVKNSGEPGGGPFFVRGRDGGISLQILEGSQIDAGNPRQTACLKASTHFNPVDLVCVLKDRNGKPFDLLSFVDEETGFISGKSYKGRELKALELPGLWNGAMSRWNTVFVEVPAETFNPVKTVLDLLRPAHQK